MMRNVWGRLFHTRGIRREYVNGSPPAALEERMSVVQEEEYLSVPIRVIRGLEKSIDPG
jgi:hypothetical protein